MPFPYGDMLATTIESRNKELVDNVSKATPLLVRLQSKGKIKTVSGGTSIVESLEIAENGTVGWYSGYETLDTTPQDVFDYAEFDWRQLAGTVSISGLEEGQNSGKEAIIPLLSSRIRNLERSLKNTMGAALFNDGTTAKAIAGLRFLVSDTPSASSVVGGINQQTYPFWRNQVETGAVITPGLENIKQKLNALWLKVVRNNDKPDLIVMDANHYSAFENQLEAQMRYTSDDTDIGKAGFSALRYKNAAVVYDENAPANHSYMLNTDFLYLRPHKDKQFVPLRRRDSINQDAHVLPVVWMGAFTTSNRARQGVLTA